MIKKLIPLFFLIPFGILSAQVTIKSVKTFAVGANTDAINMCATTDLLFFSTNDNASTQGVELWTSDGSTTGTKMLKNINTYSGSHSSNPRWFKNVLGKVIFAADVTNMVNNQVKTITKLYITDGTDAGTIVLCDLSYNFPASVDVTNSVFYGKELNGKYYFSAETDTEEAELWVTDGTPAGTKMLKDIYSTTNFGSFPRNFEVLDNKLYFTAKTAEYGEELWVSDGTESGTTLVKDIYAGNNGYVTGQLIAYKGKLYFAATDNSSNKGKELWVSDGTAAGTQLFKDINPDTRQSSPSDFYIFNDKLYFSASHYQTGTELYVTDGTIDGTGLVQDLNTGTASSNPASFTTIGNTLYFVAKDATSGNELRKLAAGSQTIELVKDINPGTLDGVHKTFYADSRYTHMGRAVIGNNLVFTAVDNTNGYYQAWITDGTSAGTKKLTYNNVPGSYIIGFTVFKNEVYFFGNYYTKYELYKVSGVISAVEQIKAPLSDYHIYKQDKMLNIENAQIQPNAIATIYNTSGSAVKQFKLLNSTNSIALNDLKSGVYIINIAYENKSSNFRIVL